MTPQRLIIGGSDKWQEIQEDDPFYYVFFMIHVQMTFGEIDMLLFLLQLSQYFSTLTKIKAKQRRRQFLQDLEIPQREELASGLLSKRQPIKVTIFKIKEVLHSSLEYVFAEAKRQSSEFCLPLFFFHQISFLRRLQFNIFTANSTRYLILYAAIPGGKNQRSEA